jgi:protein gp37
MSDNTGIEWCDATWNPITGCTEVSPGCDHCYAKTFAERWRGTPGHYFENGFNVQLRPEKLDQPLRWRKPRRIFVNSMSDLFHDDVPDEYIARAFAVMAYSYWHTFQILTKRHGRMRSLLSSAKFVDLFDREFCKIPDWNDRYPDLDFVPAGHNAHLMDGPLTNVWGGVSAEDQKRANFRIPALIDTPLAVRFVSAEPLLGPIDLAPGWLSPPVSLPGPSTTADRAALAQFCRDQAAKAGGWQPFIDWVIVGGESGHGARPMHPDWARSLRDQCQQAGVAFLFKQWGEFAPGIQDYGSRKGLVRRSWYPGELGDTTGNYEIVSRVGKKAAGRVLDGRTWDQYPEAVTV